MVESTHVSHVYVSSRFIHIDSHTDEVFGSFGSYRAVPGGKCFSYRFYFSTLFLPPQPPCSAVARFLGPAGRACGRAGSGEVHDRSK